jgi:sugar phosphate isomerase/epimerase
MKKTAKVAAVSVFLMLGLSFVLRAAPETPRDELTPAARAREKLGWRLGISAYTFHRYTFFEAIDKTAELGLRYFGGFFMHQVSKDIPKNLDYELTEDEIAAVRNKLLSSGVSMPAYYIHKIEPDETVCRKLFEFCRKLGIETIVGEPEPEVLDMIERFCEEYEINLAIHGHTPDISPVYWDPKKVMEICEGRSKRIGVCPDTLHWIRSGLDPIESLRLMKDRVITLHIHDVNELNREAHDVPWGTGVGKVHEFMKEVHRLGIKPTMCGIEYAHDFYTSMPQIAQSIEFFNEVALEVAGSTE